MSLNLNKNSVKESKVLRSTDQLYIIKGNSGYKDNSGNQIIPVSLLVDYLNNEGNGLWTYGTEPLSSQSDSVYNTLQDKYTIIKVGDANESNAITIDNTITNGITLTHTSLIGGSSLALRPLLAELQAVNTARIKNNTSNFTLDNTDGTSNYNCSDLPNYANDAAADGDVNLLSGSFYTTTAGGRTVYIKP
jgi:hypothetical protein